MAIKIKNLYKSYGDLIVCQNFNMTLEEMKITGILGPSGCGKTTLLNIIAGLEEYQSGSIQGLEGKTFSYIFQEDRLLPWSTVKENIIFVLESRYDDNEAERIANQYMDMVGLREYAHYYPRQLSGGMKQRVAIARAFAYPADILLMDEPFKGLDLELKTGLIESFLKLWNQDKRTVIFVTHDMDEALSFAHDIYILEGRPLRIKDRGAKPS
ncbi:MAG: ATP-binding cassette domain-containing protein [Caldicoprobacterales bacterium]